MAPSGGQFQGPWGDSLPGWEGWGSVAFVDCGLGVEEEECGPPGGGGTGTRLGWAAGDLRVGRPRLPHHPSRATAGRVPAVCPLRLVLSAPGASCAVSTQAWKPPHRQPLQGCGLPGGAPGTHPTAGSWARAAPRWARTLLLQPRDAVVVPVAALLLTGSCGEARSCLPACCRHFCPHSPS